jgi:hypothetical protein
MVCVGCAVGSVPALLGGSDGLVSQSLLTALLPLLPLVPRKPLVCSAPHSFALRGIFTADSGVFSNGADSMERPRCFQDSNTEGWWLRLLVWLCACLWECCSRDVYDRLLWPQWFQGAQARKAGPPLNWDACAARWLGGLGVPGPPLCLVVGLKPIACSCVRQGRGAVEGCLRF